MGAWVTKSYEWNETTDEWVIRVRQYRGILCWKRVVVETFVGNGTVWHHYPSFKRASTWTEMWLSSESARLEYKRKNERQGVRK